MAGGACDIREEADLKTKVIYEDRDILICCKPAGLATQSAVITQPDVVSELKGYLGGGYLGIVHRLDQPVEGLLAFAKNQKAAAALSRQLAQGIMQKRYCALVYGQPPAERGRLTDYLRREGSLSKVVPAETAGAQKAMLEYRANPSVFGGGVSGCCCLDIRIETGRFHQIRCQLSHAGMPILGDRKYGTLESLEESKRRGISRTALCACGIRLRQPVTGEEISREITPGWMKPV